MLYKKIPLFLVWAFSTLAILMFTVCTTTQTVVLNNTSANGAPRVDEPGWVRDPYFGHNKQNYFAAVGMGSNRQVAERNATSNIAAIFGQNIQVEEKTSTSYEQLVKGGIIADWAEVSTIDVVTSNFVSFDSLIGVEIAETWYNGKEYCALAILNKSLAARVYSEMIMSNQAIVENLLDIPQVEKNTFDGLARYQMAALLADVNMSYGNVLTVIGTPVQGLKNGDDYRFEASNITKAIPVYIRIQNDKSGRIQNAFAKAISDTGFHSGGYNSLYILDVNVTASEADISDSRFKWTRIEINANLMNAGVGTILLPYGFNIREGHTTQSEADNRAIMAAEGKINEEYAKLLNDYLSSLLPGIK